MPLPVLVVHGIFSNSGVFDTMRSSLLAAGIAHVDAIDLEPNDGRAPLAELSLQVDRAAESLLRRSGQTELDVVGFSMGALVSRHWIQRRGGKDRTRRFVSISGPHHGTVNAWLAPLDGVRDMRPGSAFLRDLHADPDPWGKVELHCLWTPFDLMIVPSSSSVLSSARTSQRFQVGLHRWMVSDRRVLDAVTAILTG